MSFASGKPRIAALLAAAGNSQRMGTASSKIFLKISGRSVIERSLSRICASKYIQRVVVLAREQDLEQLAALNLADANSKLLEFVGGGATRQESVCRGLQFLNRLNDKPDFVVIHDAARCLVSTDLIDRCIEAVLISGAVSVGLPQVDSLKLLGEAQTIIQSVSREDVWSVQTPQAFAFSPIYAAHCSAMARGENAYSDDMALLQGVLPLKVIPGESTNIKITSKQDLPLAEALAAHTDRSSSKPS